MASVVNSRTELFPNRAYSRTNDDLVMDYDPECQATTPLKPRQDSYENMNGRCFTDDPSHHYEDPSNIKK